MRTIAHPLRGYLIAAAVTVATTALAAAVRGHIAPVNLSMLFLLMVVAVSLGSGRGPSALAALLGVALFDFFFVPPHLTFTVDDAQYLLTFAGMLAVGITISTLTGRLRAEAAAAGARERRATALYELSRDLAEAPFEEALFHAAGRHARVLFGGEAVVLVPGERGDLEVRAGDGTHFGGEELEAAEWVYDHGRAAGALTREYRTTPGLYVPLPGADEEVLGVLGIRWAEGAAAPPEDAVRLLETVANQLALAFGRLRRDAGPMP